MGKRHSNAMEAGENLSPQRKKRSICLSTFKTDCDETKANLDYDPVRFLRCHSKTKRDIADLSTQVWYCEFEPSVNNPQKTTQYFATCGGNSVCVIDAKAEDAVIEKKYFSKDVREMFYSLSWTTLLGYDSNVSTNILAVGGSLGNIHLIHPDTNTKFLTHKIHKPTNKDVISSLKFDTNFPNILYCATSNQVYVYDIGSPTPPSLDTKLNLLHVLQAPSEIITLAISAKPHVLLAAANDGLYGWEAPNSDDADKEDSIQFVLPQSSAAAASGTSLVDSVVCLSEGQVAAKCALHGQIYVFDLALALASGAGHSRDVSAPRTLRWSNTDNYFMNMGFATGSSRLGCGDDKGTVWVYDLTKNSNEPTVILTWPITEDPYIAKTKKLRADTYDILVDKVCFDWSGKYMVAVTSNNMVCVWKQVS